MPGENADVVETTLSASADTGAFAIDRKAPRQHRRTSSGTIGIPLAGKDFKFEHKSRLSPVPGIANQYH